MSESTRALWEVKIHQLSPFSLSVPWLCIVMVYMKKHPRADKWQAPPAHLGPCGVRCGHSALKPPASSASLHSFPLPSLVGFVKRANGIGKPVKRRKQSPYLPVLNLVCICLNFTLNTVPFVSSRRPAGSLGLYVVCALPEGTKWAVVHHHFKL